MQSTEIFSITNLKSRLIDKFNEFGGFQRFFVQLVYEMLKKRVFHRWKTNIFYELHHLEEKEEEFDR